MLFTNKQILFTRTIDCLHVFFSYLRLSSKCFFCRNTECFIMCHTPLNLIAIKYFFLLYQLGKEFLFVFYGNLFIYHNSRFRLVISLKNFTNLWFSIFSGCEILFWILYNMYIQWSTPVYNIPCNDWFLATIVYSSLWDRPGWMWRSLYGVCMSGREASVNTNILRTAVPTDLIFGV